MQTRSLGNTGVLVSPIGFGGAALSGEGRGYGFGPITDRDSSDLLLASLDAGINLFDLAPVYGFGLAEERVGRVFGDHSGMRDRVFLVSKSGITWDERRRIHQDNRPETAVRMLEESLRRLKTNVIDLYMIHWPEGDHGKGKFPANLVDTLTALNRERQAGKIRFLGLSNFNPEQAAPLLVAAPISVLQNEWNLWRFLKHPEDSQALGDFCRTHGLGLIGWGTLDKGILSERVTPERTFQSEDARSWAPWWVNQDQRWKFEHLKALKPKLAEQGMTLLEHALQCALKDPVLSCSLVGFRSKEQLRSAIAVVKKTHTGF